MPWELEDLDAPGPARVLAIDAIDEDPDQPRREFDATTLQELADTIKARGVRQPVSVRPHPTEPGRWILNFGARRLRASKLAGKTEIPVFVDREIDSYDQVIENEQRDALRPLELAMFIERQLERGQTRTDIARGIGKSAPYVTYACALIDAPDWLMELYRSGRCIGLHELYELRRLHAQDSSTVRSWLDGGEVVNRSSIQRFKDRLATQSDGLPAGSSKTSTPHPINGEATSTGHPGLKRLKEAPATVTSLPNHLELDPLSDETSGVLAAVEQIVDALKASPEPRHAGALLALRQRLILLSRR